MVWEQPCMSLIIELLERPPSLFPASVYSAINGLIYLTAGVLFVVWPDPGARSPTMAFNGGIAGGRPGIVVGSVNLLLVVIIVDPTARNL